MTQNAKKVDWAALLRLLIVVLTAVVEVIGEDNDSMPIPMMARDLIM